MSVFQHQFNSSTLPYQLYIIKCIYRTQLGQTFLTRFQSRSVHIVFIFCRGAPRLTHLLFFSHLGREWTERLPISNKTIEHSCFVCSLERNKSARKSYSASLAACSSMDCKRPVSCVPPRTWRGIVETARRIGTWC